MVGVNQFFSKMFYGYVLENKPEDMQRWGMGMLKIVAADGLSDKEKHAMIDLARCLGAPNELIDAVMKLDPEKIDLAECLRGFNDGSPARAMLYEAMVIASV